MKKYFLLPFLLVGFASVCTDSFAVSSSILPLQTVCDSLGYTEGSSCTTGGGGLGNIINECMSVDLLNCKYKTCNGKCYCTSRTSCDGGGTITPIAKVCTDTPVWGTVNDLVQTGTCTTNSGTTTIYRCIDGCYESNAIAELAMQYSFEEPTCVACPKHPDDKKTYIFYDVQSYLTSSGAGVHMKRKCAIKANSPINDTTGAFEYESDCTYSN